MSSKGIVKALDGYDARFVYKGYGDVFCQHEKWVRYTLFVFYSSAFLSSYRMLFLVLLVN